MKHPDRFAFVMVVLALAVAALVLYMAIKDPCSLPAGHIPAVTLKECLK